MHLSSKPTGPAKPLREPAYLGWTLGLPPGLPGGGITGVLPVSGVGARISGSPAFAAADWLRAVTAFPKLPEILKTLRDLKKRVEQLEKR